MERKFIGGLVDRGFLTDPEKRKKIEETRTVTFIISSSAKDRHRTVVNMKNWKLDNYNDNPIVGYQHNVYGGNMCTPDNPDDVIGRSRVYFEERNGETLMMGDVTFEKPEVNPQSEKIFQKVLAGTLNAASVGFLEIGKGKRVTQRDDQGNIVDETYFFEGQELLEWSVVNIPSNPEATARSLYNHTRAGVNFLRNIGMSKERIRKIALEVIDAMEEGEEEARQITITGRDLVAAIKKDNTGGTPLLNTKTDYIQQRKNEKAKTTA